MPLSTREARCPRPSPTRLLQARTGARPLRGSWGSGRAAIAAVLCVGLAACQTAPLSQAPSTLPTAAVTPVSAQEAVDAAAAAPQPAVAQPASGIAPQPKAADTTLDTAGAPAASRPDLWGRMRQGMRIPAFTAGAAAQRQARNAQWYESHGEHMRQVFRRARLYMFDIVEAVQAEGLPMEVALLPAVESAFLPHAVSSAAADGLWQFISSTGRRFGLKQHAFLDQRRDVRQATRAAMAYLKELQTRYAGDMQLALAAYNCGEGCIDAAVRRARARGLPGRFEDLKLNPETANYVPRLLALTGLVAEAVDTDTLDRHHLPDMPDAPYFTEVRIDRDLDVALAARLAGQSEAEFRSLNPQHKKPVIVAQVNQHVLVPVDRREAFEEALQNFQGQMASWTTYRVTQRSRVEAIAQIVGIDAGSLRRLNGIPVGHLVTADSTLLVPRRSAQQADISVATAEAARVGTTPAMVSLAVKLGRGDARNGQGWNVLARRLSVTTAQLKGWNPRLATLRPGRLVLTLPVDVAERVGRQPVVVKLPTQSRTTRPSPARPPADQSKALRQEPGHRPPQKTLTTSLAPGASQTGAELAPNKPGV